MANKEDTGNSASITFGTTGFTGKFTQLDPGEISIGDIEDSNLSTSGEKTYRAEDLSEPGELSGTVQFSSDVAIPGLGAAETVTVTFPQTTGLTTAATYAGTGYIKRFKLPTLENNVLQVAEIGVKWDGKTGPTFTAGS